MSLIGLLVVLIVLGAVLWITVTYIQPNVPGGLGWAVTLVMAIICIVVLLQLIGVIDTGVKIGSIEGFGGSPLRLLA